MISFIWLLLAFKTMLAIWFWTKNFKYSSILLGVHFLCDVINLIYHSHVVGMISFIFVPHLLFGLMAEIYESRYLRYTNLVSAIMLMGMFFGYRIDLSDCLNYFLSYILVTCFILNKSLLRTKKETFPLLGAVIAQTFEIIAYQISYSNYKIVNILNGIYYLALVIYLCYVTLDNTPILDDSPSFGTKSLQVLRSKRAAHQSNPGIRKAA